MTVIEPRHLFPRALPPTARDPRRSNPSTERTNVVPFDFAKSLGRADVVARQVERSRAFKIETTTGVAKFGPRLLLVAALVISGVFHGSVIYSMLLRDAGEEFGTLSQKTDAFSLSMEQSIVLESITNESVKAAASSSAATQAGSIQSIESTPQELAEVENDPVSDEPPPKPIKVADVTPAAVSPTDEPLPIIRGGGEPDAASEIKAEQMAETPVVEMPEAAETKENAPAKAERKEKTDKEKKTPQKESHQQVAGSATSRSNQSEATVNGRVSASRGNALTYGAQVRAKLMHNKPSNQAARGTAQVSFGIAQDGGLRYLRISQSSGSDILDNVALAMVQKAVPFEEPPPGLTAAQLSYAISINFLN